MKGGENRKGGRIKTKSPPRLLHILLPIISGMIGVFLGVWLNYYYGIRAQTQLLGIQKKRELYYDLISIRYRTELWLKVINSYGIQYSELILYADQHHKNKSLEEQKFLWDKMECYKENLAVSRMKWHQNHSELCNLLGSIYHFYETVPMDLIIRCYNIEYYSLGLLTLDDFQNIEVWRKEKQDELQHFVECEFRPAVDTLLTIMATEIDEEYHQWR